MYKTSKRILGGILVLTLMLGFAFPILKAKTDIAPIPTAEAFIAENPAPPCLAPLPFNSGYFMSFLCHGISAEKLRQELLSACGIGVVALGEKCLRVAFSSLDEEQIFPVYQAIYDTAAKMS